MKENGLWFIANEQGNGVIRRVTYQNGKKSLQRYPKAKYSHISDPEELKDFVTRLNNKDPRIERIKAKLDFNHAFINDELLGNYLIFLKTQIPNEKDAETLFNYLKRYALHFFIQKLQLSNPIQWHQNQHIWAQYLLNTSSDLDDALRLFEPGAIKSSKVLKYIINELNRFSKFLHNQKPDIPPLHFEPLSKAALKNHKESRRLAGLKKETKYIKPEDWKEIEKALSDKSWRFPILLCYCYGLRRNEAMGLTTEAVKKGYLSLEKQFSKLENGKPVLKALKSRTSRKIPHWFIEPKQAYLLIQEMNQSIMLHPDTLSHKFTTLCSELKLPDYTVHDLRRTFITNAVQKGIKPEDLRLAVGHTNGKTTYDYYVKDARQLDDEDFTLEDEAV